MKLTALTVGSIDTNCYILYAEDTRAAVVIDPSDDATLVLARIEALGLHVRAILLTHAHFDHGGDAPRICARTGAPLYAHPADRALPSWLTHGLEWTHDLADGQTLDLDGLRLRVLHTPGHTPGGVCYQIGENLFTGDTLFADGWGRTDLPGGSDKELSASLRRVIPLARKMPFFPGHGEGKRRFP